MNFTQINIDWYQSTFIFYLSLILGSYLITSVTKKTNIIGFGRKKRKLWVIAITALLFFVKGFGTTGRDLRAGYYYNFIRATSMKNFPDYTVEWGYRLLNVIVRNITDQYWIFIAIVAALSLVPVIIMLNKYSERIDLPMAVLMYVSIFFINSFSPLRMCLAASLGLFAFDAIVEKKPIKALVWIIIASLFHTSALILFIPYFFTQAKGMNKTMVAISLISLFVVVYAGRNSVTALMSGDDRYYIYQAFDSVKIGFEQFVYYVPLLYVVYKAKKYSSDKHFLLVAFSFVTTAFCVGILGYVISIFGRFRDMFLPLIIIIPYYIKVLKSRYPQYATMIDVLALVYCIARFYIFISQYYSMEDLMPYTNVFGWVI